MAHIILPHKWLRQPDYPYEVDNNHPIVLQGSLKGTALPVQRRASGTVKTPNGNLAAPLLFTITGASADDIRKGVVVAELYRSAATATAYNVWLGALVNEGTWPTDLERATLETGATGTECSSALAHNDSTIYAYEGLGGLPAVGSTAQYAINYDASITGAYAYAYKNGTSGGAFTPSGTFPWNTGKTRRIYAGTANLGINATYVHVFGSARVIPIADLLSELRRNPYQIYKPIKRVLYFDASGGGGPAQALAGDASAQSTASATLTTQIPLTGAAAVVSTSSGALSTGITLSGQAAGVSLADGVLTAQITLSGQALAQALAAAGLTTGIPLIGGAAGQAAATGELSAGVGLAGAAAALADAGGSLTTQIRLDGVALAQALAWGDLSTTPAGLSGAAGAQATAAGALLTGIPLAGAAQAYATAAGGLTTIIPLSGAAASISSATGDLTVESTLSGAAIALALAGGDLTTLIRLDGAAVARAAASGVLAGHVAVISRHVVRATAGVWKVTATAGVWKVTATV